MPLVAAIACSAIRSASTRKSADYLRAGLIDDMVISRVPVLIGEGLPLFGAVEGDVALEHVETKSFPSGLVQSFYRVRR